MSGQQILIKISAACTAIVLGAVVVGSQLGGNLENLAPKSAEEDAAGPIDSSEADDADARNEQDEAADEDEADDDAEVAGTADEDEADDDADEDEVASDESEGDEESDKVAADESPAAADEASSGDEASAEDDADEGDQQQAEAGSGSDQDGDVIYNGLPVEPGSDE